MRPTIPQVAKRAGIKIAGTLKPGDQIGLARWRVLDVLRLGRQDIYVRVLKGEHGKARRITRQNVAKLTIETIRYPAYFNVVGHWAIR